MSKGCGVEQRQSYFLAKETFAGLPSKVSRFYFMDLKKEAL